MKNILRILIIAAVLLGVTVIFTTCKQFRDDPEEFFSYWSAEVVPIGFDINIDGPYQRNNDGVLCVPSKNSLVDDGSVTITIHLRNPKKFSLVMPSSRSSQSDVQEIIRFPWFPADEQYPEYSKDNDYTLEQTPDKQALKLTYNSSFLQKYEWGTADIGPEITLKSTDGRKFGNKFRLNLQVNTPPKMSDVTIGQTTDNGKSYYVIILEAKDMDKKHPESSSTLLHKDIKTLSVISGDSPKDSPMIKFTTGNTDFDADSSERLLKANQVRAITPSDLNGADAPNFDPTDVSKPWVLRYKTDTEVQTASKYYTLTLIDEAGLKSTVTVPTPKAKVKEAKLFYDLEDISDKAGHQDSPYRISVDVGTSRTVTVNVKTETEGAIIEGTIEEKGSDGSWVNPVSIRSSDNSVSIRLTLPYDEIVYKITVTASASNFVNSDEKTFYVEVKDSAAKIDGSDYDAWEKLKKEVENHNGAGIIKINGKIVAKPGDSAINVTRIVKIMGYNNDKDDDILDANNNTFIFNISANGELTLEKLTLQNGDNTDSSKGGGAICCYPGGLTTNDVIIKDCVAEHGNGGAIYAKDSQNIRLTNTDIKGCTAKEKGGAIYTESVTGTINGCTLAGNTAKNGGGIYFFNGNYGGSIEIENCTLTGNKANNGGAIYAEKESLALAKVTIKGGTIGRTTGDDANIAVGGGSDEGGGGALFIKGATVTLNGCTIEGNKAKNGGGVYMEGGNCTLNGSLKKNTATTEQASSSGGSIYLKNGTLTMKTGAEILDSEARASGGGVYISAIGRGTASFTMEGGTISGCKVSSAYHVYGGGVCVEVPHGSDGTANFIMQGGSITGCEAVSGGHNGSPSGGGVCVKNGATFTMTGGSITGCKAVIDGNSGNPASKGGGVHIDEHSTFNMSGSSRITGCTAESSDSGSGGAPSFNGGGVYVDGSTATFTMKDSAVITPSLEENTDSKKFNDVYLDSSAKITVDGTLSSSGGKVARITPSTYGNPTPVQVLNGSTTEQITKNYMKFEVTPKGSTPWYVGSDGFLTTTPPSP